MALLKIASPEIEKKGKRGKDGLKTAGSGWNSFLSLPLVKMSACVSVSCHFCGPPPHPPEASASCGPYLFTTPSSYLSHSTFPPHLACCPLQGFSLR